MLYEISELRNVLTSNYAKQQEERVRYALLFADVLYEHSHKHFTSYVSIVNITHNPSIPEFLMTAV